MIKYLKIGIFHHLKKEKSLKNKNKYTFIKMMLQE